MAGKLTSVEEADRQRLEGVVRAGISTAHEVWLALAEIRDRSLFRSTHKTFPQYLREVWNLSKSEAYRRIQYAGVYKAVNRLSPGEGQSVTVDRKKAKRVVAEASSAPPAEDQQVKLREIWKRITAEEAEHQPPPRSGPAKKTDARAKLSKLLLKSIAIVERWRIDSADRERITLYIKEAIDAVAEAMEV